jgi:prophage regulatory protein
MTTRTTPDRILRLQETRSRAGNVCRTTIYDWVKAGRFPRPVKLGPRSIGWRESDINDWLNSREQVG